MLYLNVIFRNCVIKGVRCGVEGWRGKWWEEKHFECCSWRPSYWENSPWRAADAEQTPKPWVMLVRDAGYTSVCSRATWFYQATRGHEIQLDQAWVKCQVKEKPNTRITAKLGMVIELMFVKCHRSSTFFRHLMTLWHKEKAKQRATFTSAPLKTQGTKSVPDVWVRTKNCLQPQ